MPGPEDIRFTFGKFKGRTILDVSQVDIEYLYFIETKFKDDSFIKKQVVEFLNRRSKYANEQKELYKHFNADQEETTGAP